MKEDAACYDLGKACYLVNLLFTTYILAVMLYCHHMGLIPWFIMLLMCVFSNLKLFICFPFSPAAMPLRSILEGDFYTLMIEMSMIHRLSLLIIK